MVGFFSSGIIHFNRVFHINHPFYPFWGTSILYTPQLPGGFKYLIFSPRKLGKISNFTHTFQMGWNHQLVLYTPPRLTAWTWSHDGLVQMILRNPFGGPYSQVPAVNLLGCIFNSVQTKIPSQTAWTHTRAKMMGYQLDDSILLHKKIGVKHQTSSWYCWWFRKPKQPPMGCFWNPANNGDLTIWTGDRRISSINSIRLFRVPEWHAFVCFNCVSRPRWWNHVWIQRSGGNAWASNWCCKGWRQGQIGRRNKGLAGVMQLPMLQGSNKQQMLLAILRDVSIIVFFLNIFWVDYIYNDPCLWKVGEKRFRCHVISRNIYILMMFIKMMTEIHRALCWLERLETDSIMQGRDEWQVTCLSIISPKVS